MEVQEAVNRFADRPRRVSDLKRILHEVATEYKVAVHEMQSPRKFDHLVRARAAYCYRATMETGASARSVGEIVGHKCHTSTFHAIMRHADRLGLMPAVSSSWKSRWGKMLNRARLARLRRG